MILSTSAGASSGGSATPLSSAVAVCVPPLIALGASPRPRVAAEAGPTGFGVLPSGATAPLEAVSSSAGGGGSPPAPRSPALGPGLGGGGGVGGARRVVDRG